MEEREFRERVLSDPTRPDADVLAAARENPAYQLLLEQAQQLDTDIARITVDTPIPEGLQARLLTLPRSEPDSDENVATLPLRSKPAFLQPLMLAACLLIAIGLTVTLTLNRSDAPDAGALAMGDQALQHLYHENPQIAAMQNGSLNVSYALADINGVMSHAGSVLTNASLTEELPVRYANPCLIVPGYQSAHLILQSEQGPLSVMVINNSPVRQEFRVNDERFSGLVIPLEKGNLILISETPAALDDYRQTLTSSVGWAI